MDGNLNNRIEISVIIPCYNCSKTIDRTLQSIDNQSNTNFEVIIINDGSTDNTYEIIENWTKETKCKFKYLTIPNSGVSSARNKGLSCAKGEYILFLDSDDIYHTQFIELLVNQIKHQDIDTAFCSYTTILNKLEDTNVKNTKFQHLENNNILMNHYLMNKIPCGLWSFIYKKKIIEKNNLHFIEGVKYGEDTEFVWKYLSLCKNGVATRTKLYGYFVTEDSATKKVSIDRLSSLKAIKRVEEFLENNNSPFLFQFKEFAYSRTLISLFKIFAEFGQLEFFKQLLDDEDSKREIYKLLKFPNISIRFSAFVFLLNPYIFYFYLMLIAKFK